MSTPSGKRMILSVVLRFVLIVPFVLVAWWAIMPAYVLVLGKVAAFILRTMLGVPIESVRVFGTGMMNPEAVLNTGTTLGFILGAKERALLVSALVTNVAPYIALVLATPAMKPVRRVVILLVGVAILALTHLAFLILAFKAGRSDLMMATAQFFMMLPFLLWIVLAYWDKLISYFQDSDES
jgi:hypothetical protein